MNAVPLPRNPKIRFKKYTAKEFLEFTKNKPENERYELIEDRNIPMKEHFMMASP